jgi:hypothetical protein
MEGANKSMRRELHNFGYWVLLFCAYTIYQKYGSPNSEACKAAAPYNIMIDNESKSIRSLLLIAIPLWAHVYAPNFLMSSVIT